MKIVGCLSWYDEFEVGYAIEAAAKVCDHIVAVDGRWDLYPAEGHLSDLQQATRILATARIRGIGVTVIRPETPWKSDGFKRQTAFRVATALGADWLLQFDADERVECDEPELLREFLAKTVHNVVGVWRYNDTPPTPGQERHSDVRESWLGWLVRALPDIEVVPPTHFHFVSHGTPLNQVEVEQNFLKLRHLSTVRNLSRQEKKREYIQRRKEAGEQ